jgi:hypothetical protein
MSGPTSLPPSGIIQTGVDSQLLALAESMLSVAPTTEPAAPNKLWRDGTDFKWSAGIPPVITDQPDSATIASGATATLSVTATNATSYQWSRNTGSGWATISGARSASYTTPVLTYDAGDGYQYRCAVTGPGGSATSDAASVTVHLTGDRYVSAAGSDLANGLTRATAWATFGRLDTWIDSLANNTTATVVVLAGTYTDAGIDPGNANTINLTIDFEEGVTVDTSAAVTAIGGIRLGTGSTVNFNLTCNLRGATFLGNSVGSANGIGTTNAVRLTVNGAAADGTKTVFSGYDDGVSFHGTDPGTGIVINDCRFTNGVKSAFTHVASGRGTFNRCVFEGRAASANGVGTDLSSLASTFYDCDFVPATTGQLCNLRIANRCRIGTLTMMVDNLNGSGLVAQFTDCFLNLQYEGPGNVTLTRCYGYVNLDRIRGTAADAALIQNCVFEGRTNSLGFIASDFGTNDGTWLGGAPIVRDCVLYDYGTAFGFVSGATWQRDHMNANWTVNRCAMFENTANFAAGLTLGTNLVTSDPLLSSARTSSTAQADWCVGVGSPCIGAGTSGSNIGFAAGDIP